MKQPNNLSCLPTAYAIITGQTVETVISRLGHDGSQIVQPNLPAPGNMKGFHIHEIIDLAFKDGYAVTPIEANPIRVIDIKEYNEGFDSYIPLYEKAAERFRRYLEITDLGIMTGMGQRYPHAVAYLMGEFFDPKDGLMYNQNNLELEVEVLWAFSRIKSSRISL